MQNYRKEHIDDRREYDEIHKDVIRVQQKKYIDEHRERINELKMLNYHKNKKIPTEEEIEAKKLRQKQRLENLHKINKEKYDAKIAENPNYFEELKAKQNELKKGYRLKYHLKKQAEKKAKKEEKNTI